MEKLYLDQDEQTELVKKSMMGDKAAEARLLQFTYPFLTKLASQFVRFGCEFEDLVQEGYMGILHAIPRYRTDKGARFITYALPWALKRMRNYSYEQRMIRIPNWKIGQVTNYHNILSKIDEGLLNPMSDEEMAKELGTSLSELNIIKTLPVSFLKTNPLYETKEEAVQDVDDLVIQKVLLEQAISQLSKEEQYVIYRYYHLDGKAEKVTYSKIAEEMNCSQEWVRQLILKSKDKLESLLQD